MSLSSCTVSEVGPQHLLVRGKLTLSKDPSKRWLHSTKPISLARCHSHARESRRQYPTWQATRTTSESTDSAAPGLLSVHRF